MKNGIIDAAVSRERCTVMIKFRALADLTPLESNTGFALRPFFHRKASITVWL